MIELVAIVGASMKRNGILSALSMHTKDVHETNFSLDNFIDKYKQTNNRANSYSQLFLNIFLFVISRTKQRKKETLMSYKYIYKISMVCICLFYRVFVFMFICLYVC